MTDVSQVADLVAYNPAGQIALLVEVKGRTDRSRSWAMQMRRNMLAHGGAPQTPFLLLALPDRLYLWKDVGNTPELIEPTYEIDPAPFFQPYYAKAHTSPDQLTAQSFELIVASSAERANSLGPAGKRTGTAEAVASGIGLVDAIRGGSVAVAVPT